MPSSSIVTTEVAKRPSWGRQLLSQIGVAKSDMAMQLRNTGREANWLDVSRTDTDLLSLIGEDEESILKRKYLVDMDWVQRKWNEVNFICNGKVLSNKRGDGSTIPLHEQPKFTWVMTIIIVASSWVLTPGDLQETFIDVMLGSLDREEEDLRQSLRLLIESNTKAWASNGQVKNMDIAANKSILSTLREDGGASSIRQLTEAERVELKGFLVWLLAERESIDYYICSRLVFAVAVAMMDLGLKIRCDNGEREYPTEPVVRYEEKHASPEHKLRSFVAGAKDLGMNDRVPAVDRAHQIAFPSKEPSTLIDTMTCDRALISEMQTHWFSGAAAAKKLRWMTQSRGSFRSDTSEIYYLLDKSLDLVKGRFSRSVNTLADQAFPFATESGMSAAEGLLQGCDGDSVKWLQNIIQLQTMEETRDILPFETQHQGLFLKYQALVFGFYYELFEALICRDLVRDDACCWSICGPGSTMLLAACRSFTLAIRKPNGVRRSQILYLLANLYSGRQKRYHGPPTGSGGLLGILGRISILTKPLMHVTDDPKEIMKFTLLDLPIVDLAPDTDGELRGGHGGGGRLKFEGNARDRTKRVAIGGPLNPERWTLHAKMGLLFGNSGRGVVMAARCDGVLIGCFNPLAADLAFLNHSNGLYLTGRGEVLPDGHDGFGFKGIEIKDDDWKTGNLPALDREATSGSGERLGIVHSKGCPELRYAAAGFFMDAHIEMAIVENTDEATMVAAYERLASNGKGGYIIC
ncbi:hypothetical protein BJ508DRAFT_172902 [Ascobolus immersus RN42]|uniref:Uncharacterized protein n=1 Tax=Ascobolus immersus RN42 TaxID=1160509 RepID=A0A3N4HXF6_ASCIM|nr:hypothetical protein BJ508DRAFT_172902 [Ascobolus immersus RN42]